MDSALNTGNGQAEKLGVGTKIGYGIGDFAANIVFQSVSMFLLYFFTDVFLISATAAGSIFLIAKLWNAFCDPAMGYIADRTNTRWGKNRPFLLFGAFPLGIAFFLLFFGPQLSSSLRIVYALVTFLFFSAAYSVVNIPYGALTANLTLDTHERSALTGFRMMFAILGTLMVAGTIKPLVAMFPSELTGFRMIGAIFGSLCIIVNIFTFASVKEKFTPVADEKKPFREDLKMVMQNKPFIILTVSTILQMVAIWLLASMTNYYFKYNLAAEKMIPVAFLCLFVTAMAALPFWVFMTKKWSKKNVLVAGTMLMGIMLLSLLVLPQENKTLIFGVFILAGFGMSALYLCPWAMIPDTVEYSQWKTGMRREGILYGFFNFAFKFSAAFSGIIAGFGLDYFGYVPNVLQKADTLFGIKMIMTAVPFFFILAGIIVILFYPIDTAMHEKMVGEIKIREANSRV